MLRKIAFILTAVAVLMFLVFLCTFRSSLYTIMSVNYQLVGWAGIVLFLSIIFSIISFAERKRVRIWFLLFQFGFLMVLTFTFMGYYNSTARPAFSSARPWRLDVEFIRSELLKYAKIHNGTLPDANDWCNLLSANISNSSKLNYILRKQETGIIEVGFNRALSKMPINSIDGKVVLLVQSQGGWSLHGGKELMDRSERYPHVYILFFDGTFGDYDVSDNSLRFIDLGLYQADYLPLKWKP